MKQLSHQHKEVVQYRERQPSGSKIVDITVGSLHHGLFAILWEQGLQRVLPGESGPLPELHK